ncbi:MAG: hypothetical protein LBP94_07245 [Zoogloeaceae bacterium]|jgi:type III secretory pathway component EscU|nr:hypothetical protein [Zoogloeaceae bacterium]
MKPTRKCPRSARQKGQAIVEYTVCAVILITALFIPFGDEKKSAMDRMMEAIKKNHEITVYAIGNPVVGSTANLVP